MGLLREALPVSTLLVAIDPGKVSNRVWLSSGEAGPVVPPMSLPVLRSGSDELHRLVASHTGLSAPVFAIEATGGLHQAWVRELAQPAFSRDGEAVRTLRDRRRPRPAGLPPVQDRRSRLRR